MENNVIKGYVHSFESFGSADGPGVRSIIFMSGCAMRCQYCHNPDTWKMHAGTEYTADELLKKAVRYKSYWRERGGITVSGGEAMLQIDFVTDLFKKAKAMGINTCIDTSGNPFTREEPFFSKWQELMKYTDLLLLDIKHIDSEKHKALTGQPNDNIIDMANLLSEMGKPVWIRHVLVPGITDDETYLRKLSDYIKTLKNVERVEVLPYHTLGVFKWENLGIEYPLEGVPTPTKEELARAKEILGAL